MKRLQAITMLATLTAGAVVAPVFAADATVGGFYTRLAQAKKLDAASPAASESSLRGAGFALPTLGLDKVLTEGDVASIAGAMGLKVTTTHPASVVNDVQMDSFFASFNTQLQSGGKAPNPSPYQIDGAGTGGTDPGQSGNGKGKKKGHNKSPAEPV